jgi:dGTPase
VAGIARTMARALRLNQDLAEAIAMAHDLGHTPFGHAGEAALHELMAAHGGFNHNTQGLRIVEVGGTLSRIPRPQPHLGGARGHHQARHRL